MKKDYSTIAIDWKEKTRGAPQQRLIYECLLKAERALTPKEISDSLDAVGYDYVRRAVVTMVSKGLLVTDDGQYWINTGISQEQSSTAYPPDASEDELRRAMSQLPWACALVDEDWRFYFATASYINAYGLEDQAPIEGKTIGEIMPDVQAELTPGITAILDRGEAYHTSEPQPWPRADGKLWELVYSLYPWRYNGKRGTIIECRSIRVDGVERIPYSRDVQSNVRVNTPSTISKSTYGTATEKPVYIDKNPTTLEDKILSLVDLDAMKQLIDAGAGDVQEGFYSTFRRMHEDGEVYRFTVRVDVERERPKSTSRRPQTDEGSPPKE